MNQEFHDSDLQRAFSRARASEKPKKKRLLPWLVGGSIVLTGATFALRPSSKQVDPVQQAVAAYDSMLKQNPQQAADVAYMISAAALASAGTEFSARMSKASIENPNEFRLFERIRYALLAANGGAQEHQAFGPSNLAYIRVKDVSGAEISVQRLDSTAYTVAAVASIQSAESGPQGASTFGLIVQQISPTISTSGVVQPPSFGPSGTYAPVQRKPLEQHVNQTGSLSAPQPGVQVTNLPNLQMRYQPPTLERLTSGAMYNYATHRVQNR